MNNDKKLVRMSDDELKIIDDLIMENESKNILPAELPQANMMQQLMERAMQNLQKRKEEILTEKLAMHGYKLPTEPIRFSPLLCMIDKEQKEFFFYNDGTKQGLFVVGFKAELVENTNIKLVTINTLPPELIIP